MFSPCFGHGLLQPVFAVAESFVACVVLPALLIGAVFGAVILRTACHVTSVKVPDFGKAFGTIIFAGIASIFINAVMLVGINAVTGNADLEHANWSAASAVILGSLGTLVAFGINFLVTSAIYASMLEISMARGLLVNVAWHGIALLSAVAISLVAGGVIYLTSPG